MIRIAYPVTEEEEAIVKRNLFKRMEEANNVKAADNIQIQPCSRSRLLDVLQVLNANSEQSTKTSKTKTIKLSHPKLKTIKENFAKPSPDHLIHISRND